MNKFLIINGRARDLKEILELRDKLLLISLAELGQ